MSARINLKLQPPFACDWGHLVENHLRLEIGGDEIGEAMHHKDTQLAVERGDGGKIAHRFVLA